MAIRHSDFQRIRSVVAAADVDEPLTAREILSVLEAHGEEFESAHEVATVLGRRADRGDVEIIRDRPYRYQFTTPPN
ncbi:hypothetical protein SAMN05216559_1186 [Halomicrobium zhouii]|uniref:Uncharacterized protein n=1 Tax=Halomicrobium zhouii TaxID=767519 RepID=A0A1I6KNX2_9EURY|nr:hypothetical protein [Halomicrobium zhouii]SFR92942.1 hypothetical protein SAMN05216559_1186 [Halomicrobium zhouii]